MSSYTAPAAYAAYSKELLTIFVRIFLILLHRIYYTVALLDCPSYRTAFTALGTVRIAHLPLHSLGASACLSDL